MLSFNISFLCSKEPSRWRAEHIIKSTTIKAYATNWSITVIMMFSMLWIISNIQLLGAQKKHSHCLGIKKNINHAFWSRVLADVRREWQTDRRLNIPGFFLSYPSWFQVLVSANTEDTSWYRWACLVRNSALDSFQIPRFYFIKVYTYICSCTIGLICLN